MAESIGTVGNLQYTVTGATGGVEYDLQLRAVNEDGPGPWSAATTGVPMMNARPWFREGANIFRSVAKNSRGGAPVGAPVTASDPEGDTLIYTVSGLHADLFAIESRSGQIRVAPDTTVGNEPGTVYIVEATAAAPFGLGDPTLA